MKNFFASKAGSPELAAVRTAFAICLSAILLAGPAQAGPDLTGYTLSFSDEFDTMSIAAPSENPTTKWTTKPPYGAGFGDATFSNPSQYEAGHPFSVSNGILTITCKKINGSWRSGLISSVCRNTAHPDGVGFSQAMGYWEARMKFPAGSGVWPGFWLLGMGRLKTPREQIAEIDIVEYYCQPIDQFSEVLHVWSPTGVKLNGQQYNHAIGSSLTTTFNTYGVLIEDDFLSYYWNGVLKWQVPTPPEAKKPMWVMAEYAIGAGWPIDEAALNPSYTYIDYIRVYAPPAPGGDTQAPTVPTNLAGTVISSSQINLSWTASTDNTGVTGYKIYRNGGQVGTSANTTFNDTGLSPSTAYNYTVSAYDAANNNSAQTASISRTTQAGAGAGTITLTEGISPTADWPVAVDVATADPGENAVGVVVNASTIVSQTFTPETNMTLGDLYFSYSTSAASSSNAFTLKIQAVSGPGVASYTAGTNLLGSPAVTFSLASTGGAIRLLKLEFDGSYQIGLTAGTTYAVEISSAGSTASFYRRASETYAGGALYTNRSAYNYPSTRDIAMAVVAGGGGGGDSQAPTVPTNLAGTVVSSSQINLAWTASTDNVGVTGYKIFRNGSQIATSATNTYYDTGLSPGTSYSYTVSAYDAANNHSAQTASISRTTQASGSATLTRTEGITPTADWPLIPTISTADPGDALTAVAVNGSTVVSQTFTPASNMTLDELYFSYSTTAASAGNAFTVKIQAVSGPAVTSYTAGTNLLGSTPATFSLASTSGATRLMKLEFSGSYQIALAAGTTYAVEISSTGSALTLYRRAADSYSGGVLYVNRSAFNSPSTRDLAMAVVAIGGGSGGGDTQAPSIPTNLAGTVMSSSQINLAWTASTDNVGVTGYKIYRNDVQIGTSQTNSFNDTGLSASTTYTYTVAAYDAASNTSSESAEISRTTQASGSGTIILTEGISPTTDWPVEPDVETADPGLSATGQQVNSSNMVSQTFTPAANMTLGELYFTYSTSAASTSNAFTVKIQTVSGPAVTTYTAGTNLLGATPVTFGLASTGGATRIAKLQFTGAYQIALNAGTTYAVEISSTGSQVVLYRRAADLYTGGVFYLNRSAYNSPSTRDIAMAIVAP